MAVVHDARVLELVEELGGDRVRGLFRELLQGALQELIDTELTARIGAGRHERTETRTNRRNGARRRLLSTPAGDVELAIPKVRTGSFFPSLLEPRCRVDRALWAVIMTAYVTGTSTRKVDDLV
jgi:putative transposase